MENRTICVVIRQYSFAWKTIVLHRHIFRCCLMDFTRLGVWVKTNNNRSPKQFMKRFLIVFLMAMASLVTSAQEEGFVLLQNYPNPFRGTTTVYLATENAGETRLIVSDLYGHYQYQWSEPIMAGLHQFQITLHTKGIFVLGAQQNGQQASIMLSCEESGGANNIEYLGWTERIPDEVYYVDTPEDSEDEFVSYASQEPKSVVQVADAEPFRVALSLSPFTLNQFDQGYTFKVGDQTATTPKELQQIYNDLGSTEMYVRLATKRHKTYNADGTLDNTTDGKADENANVHTFDQVMQTCRIAAELNIPINPEVMCAYIYMDMDGTQAPRFYEDDYPELYAKPEFYKIMHDRKWEELSLEEICTVLEMYGEFVADSILATGCTVNNWNLGNEANFGFAGIGIGTPNSFDKKLAKAGQMKRYMSSLFSLRWLKKHVWNYEAQTLAAVKRGILNAYNHYPELDASKVKFSTHIATVTSTPRATAAFFTYMAEHGYAVETAGISYYPSAPAMSFNKKAMLTKTVTRINKKCGVPVFIGEFSYPSQEMVGPFAGWNKQLKGYEKDQQGQADIYKDVIDWGKDHGLAGIRYWAPDYEGEWYPMSMFEFSDKVGTAKTILKNHKEIVED